MKTVLVVEDDHFFGTSLTELLVDNGLEAVLLESVEDTLAHSLDQVDAAIVDVMLPNDPEKSGISLEETRGNFLSGVALSRKIREKAPNFPIILFSADIAGSAARDWALDNDIPFVIKSDGPRKIVAALKKYDLVGNVKHRAFIVHGHDEKSLLELKDYLQNTLHMDEPIVLREQPNRGKTIIEKFEHYANRADYVFVLLTPDDIAINPADPNDEKRRARQNVIFELGFFYGQFLRSSGRIIVLHRGPLEMPTDIEGIAWIGIDDGVKAAGEAIRKELNID